MFTLDPLPFAYNALEPYIDEATMRLHHDKHHQTYVDKLNEIVAANPDLEGKTLEELCLDPRSKNMAGGVYNHNLFWKILDGAVRGERLAVSEEIKKEFTSASLKLFGSGWVWIVKNETNDELSIINTANQDVPPANVVTGIDLWEHAYYLKYQNRRKDYVEEFAKLAFSS